MTTTTWTDVREFLEKEGYKVRSAQNGKVEVYRLRAGYGLRLRYYTTPANALRGLGYQREYEEWRLARWQEAAS